MRILANPRHQISVPGKWFYLVVHKLELKIIWLSKIHDSHIFLYSAVRNLSVRFFRVSKSVVMMMARKSECVEKTSYTAKKIIETFNTEFSLLSIAFVVCWKIVCLTHSAKKHCFEPSGIDILN